MTETILLVVLIVVLIGLMVASYMKKKKYNNSLADMRDQLVIGDKVMTDSGIVGEVVDFYEEDGFKYFVLKSGKGQNTGFYTVHANAIYYVFGKDEKSQPKQEETEQQIKIEDVEKEQKQAKKSTNKKAKK